MSGSGFAGGDAYRCRFGVLGSTTWTVPRSNVVHATFVDATTVRCPSLNATAAHAMAVLHVDFSASHPAARLRGYARLEAGKLLLMRAPLEPHGGALFDVGRPVPAFHVRFMLVLCEGAVLEFIYGALPHDEAVLPCTPRCASDPQCLPRADCEPLEARPGAGLRLRLDASPPHTVEIVLDGLTLTRRSPGVGALLTQAIGPVAVGITLQDDALSLTYAGARLVEGFRLPGWTAAVRPLWRKGLSAAVVAAEPGEASLAGSVLVDHFDVTDVATDGQVRQARVQFAISINAQQFSRDSSQFGYFSPPTLSRVVPSSGTSAGGTVVTIHGSNFNVTATHILCSFAIGQRVHGPLNGAQWAARLDVSDGTRDSDEAIRCRAPRAAAMLAEPYSSNVTNASRSEGFESGGEGAEGAVVSAVEDETSSGSRYFCSSSTSPSRR